MHCFLFETAKIWEAMRNFSMWSNEVDLQLPERYLQKVLVMRVFDWGVIRICLAIKI